MGVEGRRGFHAGPPGTADSSCIPPCSSTPIHCWIRGSHGDTCLRFVEPQAVGRGREVIGSDKPQSAPGAAGAALTMTRQETEAQPGLPPPSLSIALLSSRAEMESLENVTEARTSHLSHTFLPGLRPGGRSAGQLADFLRGCGLRMGDPGQTPQPTPCSSLGSHQSGSPKA